MCQTKTDYSSLPQINYMRFNFRILLIGISALLIGLYFQLFGLNPPVIKSQPASSPIEGFFWPDQMQLRQFDLIGHDNQKFDVRRFSNHWSFVFFGYTHCPDICPITMSVLGHAEELLVAAGEEPFQGILVTVDPERDTASALTDYVQAFSGDFVGVTGAASEIYTFAKSFHAGFSKALVADSALGYLMDHSGRIAVVDPLGRHYGNIKSPFDATGIATLYRALATRRALVARKQSPKG